MLHDSPRTPVICIAGKEGCTNGFYQHHVCWNKGNREGEGTKQFKRYELKNQGALKGQNLGLNSLPNHPTPFQKEQHIAG